MKVFLLLTMFLSTPTFAQLPFLHTAKNQLNRSSMKCADFSGTWAGECQYTNDWGTLKTPFSVSIEMNCDVLLADGIRFLIGGVKTETEANRNYQMETRSEYDWTESNQVLAFSELQQVSNFDPKRSQVTTSRGTIRMNESRLEIKSKWSSAGWPDGSFVCELSKTKACDRKN